MRKVLLVVVVLAFGAGVIAPTAANQAADSAPKITGAKPGGELIVYRARDFRSLDPTRLFNIDEVAFGSFLFRTLTQYRTINGKTELLPDLATSLGNPSSDYRTWKYRLRSGVKFQDGKLITCQDIKYGVMRAFADDILSGGAPYAKMYLQTSPAYRGPFNEPEQDLKSVVCSADNKMITFKLNRPVQYFDQITALPNFAPVPKSQDTKQSYGLKPFSSGPYQVQTWNVGRELVLVRNKFWDSKTDPTRWAYPDSINVKLAMSPDIIEQLLLSDRAESQQAVMMDVSILINRKQVNNLLDLSRRSTSISETPSWFAINADTVKNPKVRRAIQCAVDYRSVIAAAGGQQYAKISSSIIPTNFNSAFRRYEICGRNVATKPQAQTETATKLLSGISPADKQLSFFYSDRGAEPLMATAIAQSLRQVGFQVNLNRIPQNLFSATIRERKTGEPDLMLWGRWRPDWQAASGQIYPLLDGRTMSPTSAGNNFARQNFAELQQLFSKADSAKSPRQQEQLLGKIEELAVRKYAVLMPLVSQRLIFLAGSKVGGVELSRGHNVLTFAAVHLKP
jgi:peptide/nickel transport system substrate-binding protein